MQLFWRWVLADVALVGAFWVASGSFWRGIICGMLVNLWRVLGGTK